LNRGNIVKNVDKIICCFLEYLNYSLPQTQEILGSVDEYDEVMSDWMQSSWETLVETALFYGTLNSLPIYGEGADVCKGSSRVTFPSRHATHKIICTTAHLKKDLISGKTIDISDCEFEQFVKWKNNWYTIEQGLDAILLSKDNEEYVVFSSDVIFEVNEI